MKRTAVIVVLGLSLFVAACGNDVGSGTTTGATTTEPAESGSVKAYFLRDGKVWPVRRDVPTKDALEAAALEELLAGPTNQEAAELAASSAIPESTTVQSVHVEDGVAHVELSAELPDEALAQVVYTVSQFPTVESVEIQGRTLTRKDFEDVTPAILVESPLSFDEVSSPLRVTGTANTFEATFAYQLTDADGQVVAHDFVTATSGTGTRGTFDFTIPFTVAREGTGALIVFENSAEDGSWINLVGIPLTLSG